MNFLAIRLCIRPVERFRAEPLLSLTEPSPLFGIGRGKVTRFALVFSRRFCSERTLAFGVSGRGTNEAVV